MRGGAGWRHRAVEKRTLETGQKCSKVEGHLPENPGTPKSRLTTSGILGTALQSACSFISLILRSQQLLSLGLKPSLCESHEDGLEAGQF